MKIKQEKLKKKNAPSQKDSYKGARDNVKFILEDKNGNRTEIKR